MNTTQSNFKSTILLLFVLLGLSFSKVSAQIDMGLIGSWNGTISQPGFPYYPGVIIISDLVISQNAGTSNYPTGPCSGSLYFDSVSSPIHYFTETITTGMANCPNGIVELYRDSLTDSMYYYWYDAANPSNSASGSFFKDLVNLDEPTSIENVNAYPNPFQNELNIDLAITQEENLTIYLQNNIGQVIRTMHVGSISPSERHTFKIDTSELPNGIYFARMKGSSFNRCLKVSIVR